MTKWWTDVYGDPCVECGFDWSITARRAAAEIQGAPARYRELLDGTDGSQRLPELAWSAKAYVFHVADNLWIWAERMAGAVAGASGEVPGYDQDRLAKDREYENMPVESALWSLDRAVTAWMEVFATAEERAVVLVHPYGGRLEVGDVALGNGHDVRHHTYDLSRLTER